MSNAILVATPMIEDLFASLLFRIVILSVDKCGYSGSFNEIFVIAVHPIFFTDRSESSKVKNPNQHQAMNGAFAYEY